MVAESQLIVDRAIRKFQESVGMKETGTLNKETLEKMNITLTDKQKTM